MFVCSSGNKQKDISVEQIYPASYELDNVIAVSAINSSGKLYKYSGFGKKVDVLAPGENIYCVLPENDRIYMDGTSLATAYVTGTAALLLSNYPELKPIQIKKIIKKSATIKNNEEKIYKSCGILNVKGCFELAEKKYLKYNEKGEYNMNSDSLYSILFVCGLLAYAILICIQLKRIIKDRNYRNAWVIGGTILSFVICLLGILTPLNIAGATLLSIFIMIFLIIKEKKTFAKVDQGQ